MKRLGHERALVLSVIAAVTVLLGSGAFARGGDVDSVAGSPGDTDGLNGSAGDREGVGSLSGDGEWISAMPGDLDGVLGYGRRAKSGDVEGVNGRTLSLPSYPSNEFWFAMSTIGVWRLR